MRKEDPAVSFIEQCYELYEQKMYRVAYNILHDAYAAEDAVQDAFVKLMRSQVLFEDPTSDDCKKYLITVIKNASYDIYNRRAREITEMPEIGVSYEHDPGTLRSLIEKLPEKYRTVTECIALRGMSVRETAERLGISEPLVRKRYERAKDKLRKGGAGYEI